MIARSRAMELARFAVRAVIHEADTVSKVARDRLGSTTTPRNLSASTVLAKASASLRRLNVLVTTRPPMRVRTSYRVSPALVMRLVI